MVDQKGGVTTRSGAPQIMLLLGSWVVAAEQIGKAIISLPAMRAGCRSPLRGGGVSHMQPSRRQSLNQAEAARRDDARGPKAGFA